MHVVYIFCCKEYPVGNGDVYCSIVQLLRKLCSNSFKRLHNPVDRESVITQQAMLVVADLEEPELLARRSASHCWREPRLSAYPVSTWSILGRACLPLLLVRYSLTSAGMGAVVVAAVLATSSKNPARISSNASLCCMGSSVVRCKMPDTRWTCCSYSASLTWQTNATSHG